MYIYKFPLDAKPFSLKLLLGLRIGWSTDRDSVSIGTTPQLEEVNFKPKSDTTKVSQGFGTSGSCEDDCALIERTGGCIQT